VAKGGVSASHDNQTIRVFTSDKGRQNKSGMPVVSPLGYADDVWFHAQQLLSNGDI
jgi:hypothetical protein